MKRMVSFFLAWIFFLILVFYLIFLAWRTFISRMPFSNSCFFLVLKSAVFFAEAGARRYAFVVLCSIKWIQGSRRAADVLRKLPSESLFVPLSLYPTLLAISSFSSLVFVDNDPLSMLFPFDISKACRHYLLFLTCEYLMNSFIFLYLQI